MPVMESTLLPLLARLLLVGVFLVAAFAKWRDPVGVAETLIAFGLPEPLAWPLRRLLPALELGVALALIMPQTVWWGAIAALSLLLIFTIAIAANLARGSNPPCNCFGQLSSKPLGAGSLARNVVLALAAAFLVALGPSGAASLGALQGASSQTVLYVVGALLLVLVVAQAALTFSLLRGHGRLLLRIDALEEQLRLSQPPTLQHVRNGANGAAMLNGNGAANNALAIGKPAPEFEAIAPDGSTRTLADLRSRGKPVMLLFAEPGCGPCRELLPDVKRWQAAHLDKLTIALITGAAADNLPLPSALRQQDGKIAAAYGVGGTPAAVLVRAGGAIASTQARGAQEIRDLLQQALALGRHPAARANGNGGAPHAPRTPAQELPPLELPDLDGHPVALAALRHRLLLFWNPSCGYCQRMLDDLRRWEQERPSGAPEIVLISKGGANANRALNLRATILLDDNFEVGRAVGAGGTPSAVLIDNEGKIASPVVAGAPAVMSLARGAREATKEVSHEPVA